MQSLKKSFASCMNCNLLEESSCILETNCEKDLTKVDVIFIAENPGKVEIKKERPLVGKAGKKFRQYFEKYGLNKKNYLLTNIVLCQTIEKDGIREPPLSETIELCKINCMNIIRLCQPKLVVLMGTISMSAFGIAEKGITTIHEKYEAYKWEEFDTMVIVHPSFVNHNLGAWEDKFEESFQIISKRLGGKKIKKESNVQNKVIGKGIHYYKIPEKFYTDKYRLIDIQHLSFTGQVLYIFRDNNNKKIYHKEKDNYICYQTPKGVESPKILPYDQLEKISIKYKDRYQLDSNITYEGDVRITAKHAIDYYHFNKGDAKIDNMNIHFFDIEIDAGIDNKAFPHPSEALHPINMITSIYQNPRKKILYVLHNNTEPIDQIDGVEFKIFKINEEKKLLQEFLNDWKKYDPDFLTGWNAIPFDLEYIFNRLKKLKMKQSLMSSFGQVYIDGSRGIANIAGVVAVDQLHLYKSFTFTKKENYKLGTIAQDEVGYSKIDLPLPMNEMYWKMLNKTIEYNIRDSELLEDLENKLGHINLLKELREICNASFDSAASGFGQIDCTMISFLKDKGMASKNSNPHIQKEKFSGAYVHPPIPGIYDYITDFDFTALYPSLIMTYNIGINNFVMKTKNPEMGYNLAYHHDKLPDTIDMIIDPTYKNKQVNVETSLLLDKIKAKKLIHTINGCFFQPHEEEMSVFSQVLDHLLSSRRSYKKQMLDAKEVGDKITSSFYNTKQLVYKVLANTLYGVIANKAFRFFNLSCAAAITLGGQEALKNSIIHGESFMKHLYDDKVIESPKEITQREMYANDMPERIMKFIVTGDTDSIFTVFSEFKQEKTDEQIKIWCDKLQEYLNGTIMKYIVNSHNVSIEFNKLNLKNELIIKRGLFLAKKRYVINVTNNEGRKVNEINYMGIEIKRSDTPFQSKELLKEIINLIMSSEKVSIPRINQYINEQEFVFRELIKNGDKKVGRPVGYGKKLKDYKVIPQGVRALEAFNKISYHAHDVGSRGYLFRVSGIDLEKAPDYVIKNYNKYIKDGNKLEVVAVPDEEPCCPSYYIQNMKGNLKYVFHDRYELLLAPINFTKKNEGVLIF